MDHRKPADEQLRDAERHSGEAKTETYSTACALTGIGYALLALHDLFEEALKDAGD